MMNTNNYCVILAGGIGTRLWPSSRQRKPKQFLDLLGKGETLLQMTYKRFARFIPQENILVMANVEHEEWVREQLPDLSERNLMLEPMRRNTMPSVTWATVEIEHRNPNACVVVTPADQMIASVERFEDDIVTGLAYVANNDRLLTLGVIPTYPATSFGYIQMAGEMARDIFKVQSFTEKPQLEFAEMFVENREFLWNTGLYIWNNKTFLANVKHRTELVFDMVEGAEHTITDGNQMRDYVADCFAKCPNASLEQSVLERGGNVDVMQCHFGWSDVGTWDALYDLMATDGNNVVPVGGNAMLYDCKECIVRLPHGKIAVVQGLDDYMIVDEGDVLVICRKDDQSAIRKFVNDVQINAGDEFV